MPTPDDTEIIRQFLEHEVSRPGPLTYEDPADTDARRKIFRGLGRRFGIGNVAETCTNYVWGILIGILLSAIFALYFDAVWLVFAGGIILGTFLRILYEIIDLRRCEYRNRRNNSRESH